VARHGGQASGPSGLGVNEKDWTLKKCAAVLRPCKHPRADIAAALSTLISSPGVEISEAAIHLDALDRYRKTKVHFVDCLLAAAAKTGEQGISMNKSRTKRKSKSAP